MKQKPLKTGSKIIAAFIMCALILLAFTLIFGFWNKAARETGLKVGIICSEDEAAPYSANFLQTQYALEEAYGDDVQVMVMNNVSGKRMEESMRDLARKGCAVLFTNVDTEAAVTLAPEYPKVQFCQISMPTISTKGQAENYHTFNGEIYQARYAAGVVAGMKMQEMIDDGVIGPEEAVAGYVAANNSAEVVSGYTAFLLGIRSVCPEAVMRVRYTGSWSNFPLEKTAAQALIEEGCVVLSHHTNTMAPAIACEEASSRGRRIWFIGYHQSMVDVAPSCTLVSIRTNWLPYVLQATEAVMRKQDIESVVKGNHHGNDISAGFDQGWVQMLELNTHAAAEGTEKRMTDTISGLQSGRIRVFSGNYTGVNPEDSSDTIDLSRGYAECGESSSPSFRYVLQDVIIEDN